VLLMKKAPGFREPERAGGVDLHCDPIARRQPRPPVRSETLTGSCILQVARGGLQIVSMAAERIFAGLTALGFGAKGAIAQPYASFMTCR